MSKDFTAKTRRNTRKKVESKVPAWVWVFTGVVLGAFIMFLIRLSELDTAQPVIQAEKRQQNNKQEQQSGDQEKPIAITFYEKFKESTSFDTPEVKEEQYEPIKSKPQRQRNYLIQVASFKAAKDAEQLKVELIFLGLDDVHTKKVKLANKDTRHRVLVGPITSNAVLDSARKTLIDNKYEALVLKL